MDSSLQRDRETSKARVITLFVLLIVSIALALTTTDPFLSASIIVYIITGALAAWWSPSFMLSPFTQVRRWCERLTPSLLLRLGLIAVIYPFLFVFYPYVGVYRYAQAEKIEARQLPLARQSRIAELERELEIATTDESRSGERASKDLEQPH